MNNKKIILYIVYLVITLVVLSFALYIGCNIYKQKRLKENPSYAKGVIVGISFSSKMGTSINYQFTVEEKLYENSCLKKRKDIFNTGDSCLVIYDKNDVFINNLCRDEFSRLCLINKKDSVKEEWNKYLDSFLQKRQQPR